MVFLVETEKRNPNVKKHDLWPSANIKDDISKAKMTNVKLYIMF